MLRLLFILAVLLQSYQSFSQEQAAETEKTATFCKVWGFLKYYHPEVATGKIKWDDAFKTQLKQLDSLYGKKEIQKFYAQWIKNLGDVKACKGCINNIDDSLKINIDFAWMNDSISFDKSTIKVLHYIEKNRNQISKYYIQEENDGQTAFSKEKGYYDSVKFSPELRLLSLARYWNIINYFFPYKNIIGEDWNLVLTDMIPKFKNAEDTSVYHWAILELTARTNDGYAFPQDPHALDYYGAKWTPFQIKIIEHKGMITNFYNDSLAAIDDIQYGDVILKINNLELDTLINQKSIYVAATNPAVKMRNLSKVICNGDSDMIDITFERNGTVRSKTIHRYYYDELRYKPQLHKDTTVWKIVETNMGYINLATLKQNEVMDVLMRLKKTQSLIIDLRNVPNNTQRNLSMLLNHELLPFAKFTTPDLKYAGVFMYTPPITCGQNTNYYYPGRVMVLVNEYTEGMGEIACMALQTAPKVTLVGSQTAGSDGSLSMVTFPGGFETYMTGMGVFYPDGKQTQRVGIAPEVSASPTIEGLRAKRDEVLEAAIEYLKNN